MAASKHPYAVPAELSPSLRRVLSYWEGLKRAGNSMPFWDDIKLSALPDLADRLLLIDVFDKPERFRFNTVGKELGATGAEAGKFADESEMRGPLAFLRSQCSATVEAREPTFLHHGGAGSAYSRLLLPMWGDGRIGMLLGAIELK